MTKTRLVSSSKILDDRQISNQMQRILIFCFFHRSHRQRLQGIARTSPRLFALDNLAGDTEPLVRWIILQEILNLVSDPWRWSGSKFMQLVHVTAFRTSLMRVMYCTVSFEVCLPALQNEPGSNVHKYIV